jgi:Flp pilus assembly protein TadG
MNLKVRFLLLCRDVTLTYNRFILSSGIRYARRLRDGHRQSGQIMVILALAIASLLGVAALGIDVFELYWNKNRLQSAADAAALAGATYLGNISFSSSNSNCGYSTVAAKAACTYALANGVLSTELQGVTVDSNARSVAIQTTRIVPALFAKVIGFTQFTVSASATASLQALGSTSGVLPIGLSRTTTYSYGQAITLHSGCGNLTSPACWGALDLDGRGGSDFQTLLAQGYSGTISVMSSYNNVTGVKSGPVVQGVGSRVSAGLATDPGGSWNQHMIGNPRAAVVALTDWSGCQNKNATCSVPVTGFAQVWIIGMNPDGKSIDAQFIQQVNPGNLNSSAVYAGAAHATLMK